MVHIYPKFPNKIKEVTDNAQATLDQSTAPKIATVSMITNQNYSVEGDQHVHIGGWECYKQENKEGMKSWNLVDNESTTDIRRIQIPN